ncbi:MAG TPA: hypothetical protein VLG11_01870 [Candidatus Saccharimonadales bacterium]|nr:hypothetical protein [Candidatus Saccharimonadales bacterium]
MAEMIAEETRIAQQEEGLRRLAEMAPRGSYFAADATPDTIFEAIGRYEQSLVLCTEALARLRPEAAIYDEVRYSDWDDSKKVQGTDAYRAWREAGEGTPGQRYQELQVALPVGKQTLKLSTRYKNTDLAIPPEAAHHAVRLSLVQQRLEGGVGQRAVDQLQSIDVYYKPQGQAAPYYLQGSMYTPNVPGSEALQYDSNYVFNEGDTRAYRYPGMLAQHSVVASRAYSSHGFVGLAAHQLWDMSLRLCLAAELLV